MNDYIRLAIDKDLKEKARKFAKDKGLSLSAFIRMAIIKEMGEGEEEEGTEINEPERGFPKNFDEAYAIYKEIFGDMKMEEENAR